MDVKRGQYIETYRPAGKRIDQIGTMGGDFSTIIRQEVEGFFHEGDDDHTAMKRVIKLRDALFTNCTGDNFITVRSTSNIMVGYDENDLHQIVKNYSKYLESEYGTKHWKLWKAV